MSGEAERREHILKALARYEASGKAKWGKRKSGNLFDIERYEPRRGWAIMKRKANHINGMG